MGEVNRRRKPNKGNDLALGKKYIDDLFVHPRLTQRIAEEDAIRPRWSEEDTQALVASSRYLCRKFSALRLPKRFEKIREKNKRKI